MLSTSHNASVNVAEMTEIAEEKQHLVDFEVIDESN